jgi:hypothetical protein
MSRVKDPFKASAYGRRVMRHPFRTLAVAAGLAAIGVPATPALGAGFDLSLSLPDAPVVGKPTVLHATGTIPPEDAPYPYWFSLSAIPASVTSTCPQDKWQGVQLAQGTGGSVIVLTQRETPDASGSFTIPIGVTPSAPGSLLLCAYTDDGLTNTLAVSSTLVTIKSGSARGDRAAAIAAEARSGIRSCKALLGPREGASCIRDAVKRAAARCRKLPSRRAQAACVRGVKRVVQTA